MLFLKWEPSVLRHRYSHEDDYITLFKKYSPANAPRHEQTVVNLGPFTLILKTYRNKLFV